MRSRFLMLILITLSTLVWTAPTAEAGRFFGRRSRSHNNYSTRYQNRSSHSSRSSRSSSLHMTHSRSAILNGFFGPGSGAQGVDSSWYVGR